MHHIKVVLIWNIIFFKWNIKAFKTSITLETWLPVSFATMLTAEHSFKLHQYKGISYRQPS
jgi:hypothetical protein